MNIEEAKEEIERYAHRESGLSSNKVVDLDHVLETLDELKNDLLQNVSNRASRKEIKMYRKQGRMSVSSKVEQIYKLNSEKFDEDYCDYDFTLLHGC